MGRNNIYFRKVMIGDTVTHNKYVGPWLCKILNNRFPYNITKSKNNSFVKCATYF